MINKSTPATARSPAPAARTASAPAARPAAPPAAARRTRRYCWRRGKLHRNMGRNSHPPRTHVRPDGPERDDSQVCDTPDELPVCRPRAAFKPQRGPDQQGGVCCPLNEVRPRETSWTPAASSPTSRAAEENRTGLSPGGQVDVRGAGSEAVAAAADAFVTSPPSPPSGRTTNFQANAACPLWKPSRKLVSRGASTRPRPGRVRMVGSLDLASQFRRGSPPTSSSIWDIAPDARCSPALNAASSQVLSALGAAPVVVAA